jgi:hypothetical protein
MRICRPAWSCGCWVVWCAVLNPGQDHGLVMAPGDPPPPRWWQSVARGSPASTSVSHPRDAVAVRRAPASRCARSKACRKMTLPSPGGSRALPCRGAGVGESPRCQIKLIRPVRFGPVRVQHYQAGRLARALYRNPSARGTPGPGRYCFGTGTGPASCWGFLGAGAGRVSGSWGWMVQRAGDQLSAASRRRPSWALSTSKSLADRSRASRWPNPRGASRHGQSPSGTWAGRSAYTQPAASPGQEPVRTPDTDRAGPSLAMRLLSCRSGRR